MGVFDDLTSVPAIAIDYRFGGLVRLCGHGIPAKWIETKQTATKYRGPVVIYAAFGANTRKDDFLNDWFAKTRARLVPAFVDAETFDRQTSVAMAGNVIALATLSDVRRHDDYYAIRGACVGLRPGDKPNKWQWRLTNIWPLDPFNATPAPGFFKVPAEKVELAVCTWFFMQHRSRDLACDITPLEGLALTRTYLREHDLPGLGARWSHP